MTNKNGSLIALRQGLQETDELKLARKFAPVLRLDRSEPWRPTAIGFTVFAEAGKSPSSKFEIAPKADRVIEYAIFWDYDIQHLYDLEHVWVHLNAEDQVISVEASQHGKRVEMKNGDALPLENGRVTLWAEPGKHAHFASRDTMKEREAHTRYECSLGAGLHGVHMGNPFSQEFGEVTPYEHRLARLQMQRLVLEPSYGETLRWDCAEGDLLPWARVESWIPERVKHLISDLRETLPHFKAIFLDCGDTLIDEGTEIKKEGSDVAYGAELLPHAREALNTLVSRGYRLALVADGPRATFENILGQHDLWDHFESHTISGDVGVLKPDFKMFGTAMTSLGLSEADAPNIVMVGNNLERDIKGANGAGHKSIFHKWTQRRNVVPADASEEPTRTIASLHELVSCIEQIELSLS
ncbi:HAD family hydrolase [Pseudovibrio sp. SCP19]|uniref:HAD family hydrolase n=1 Tax=Pseudovibrio sp. SCP19 TaxID=3141374 RepID=UPI003336752F